MKRLLAVFISLLLVIPCAAHSQPSRRADAGAPVSPLTIQPGGSEGLRFPAFSAYDLDWDPVDSSIFADADYTVAVVWLNTCIPCLVELPYYQALSDHYSGVSSPRVQVVGLACAPQMDDISRIVNNGGYTFMQIFFNTFAVTQYLSDILYHNQNDCIPIPQTLIIDRSGVILAHVWGSFSGYDELEDFVSGVIGGHSPSGDADGNGFVDTTDALMVLRCALGISGSGQALMPVCDMDGNNAIDTTDALMILRIALGIG